MIDLNAPNRGDIWISDVLEAWRTLQLTTPDDRAAAAEALGFDASRLRPATESPSSAVDSRANTNETGRGATETDPASAPRTPAAPLVIPTSAVEDRIAEAADGQSWTDNASPLEAEQSAHAVFKPEHVPLFRPHWTRHLMSGVCA